MFLRAIILIPAVLLTLSPALAGAQAPTAPEAPARSGRLDVVKLLFDCLDFHCDQDYLRGELPYVDHVRNREDADVHVVITSKETGSGGHEFTLRFIGRGPFAGQDDQLSCTAGANDTEEQQRRILGRMLKLGLVRYVSHSSRAGELEVSSLASARPTAQSASKGTAKDPWNFWVFRMSSNGRLEGEESNRTHAVSGEVSANRTTDAWKINLSASGSYSNSRYTFSDGSEWESTSRSYGMDGLVVKSVNAHWSAGVMASAASSTFFNQELVLRAAPAVEWNLFPYSEYARRQLTLRYEVGFNANRYRSETIYGKTSEELLDHKLKLGVDLKQPWGSVSVNLEGAQYLPDTEQKHFLASAEMDVRLFKGCSLNLWGSTSRLHDQIYLAREAASEEEVLVRQRQLATSYRYSLWVGISYAFGSMHNNVVNTRLSSGRRMMMM